MAQAPAIVTTATCSFSEHLSDYARGVLASSETSAIERHLGDCRPCFEAFLKLDRTICVAQADDCRVVSEIGRGRFGVVYKAWWLRDRPRLVALKVLNYPGEMEKSRFDREIAVLRRLHSPWIVRCLDAGGTAEAMHYIMDYIDGVQLDAYLSAPGRSLHDKLAVFGKICQAVADAHGAGVIHRDLKPKNIIVDANGEPHVLDFGICSIDRVSWNTSARETITHTGDVIGTLRYMSPEQAWGGVAGAIDARSDLWALGIMLYEIVTDGGYPYSLSDTRDKPAHEALLDRIRKELPRLPKLAHVPRGRDLEILLERCLAWEPEQRVESAAALTGDIERYLCGQSVTTRPLALRHRVERLVIGAAARSRPSLWVAIIALSLTLTWLATGILDAGWYVSGQRTLGTGNPAADIPLRENVRIIGVQDETVDAAVTFAERNGLPSVSHDVTTWRSIHAWLMQRLVTARPTALIWDYYFSSPRPDDDDLAGAIMALENAGVPVVLAAENYHDDGTPDLSPTVAFTLGEKLRHGAIHTRDPLTMPGDFLLAAKREAGPPIPSIILTGVAAILHPKARVEVDWRRRQDAIELLYVIERGAYLRERDRIEPTKAYFQQETEAWLRKGDLLSISTLPLDPPAIWESQTTPYHALLNLSDDALTDLVRGNILIIGDLRTRQTTPGADRHRVRYGTTVIDDVPGCYLLASGIVGMLDRRFMRMAWPVSPTTLPAALVCALIGCLLPLRVAPQRLLDEPRNRRMLEIALVTVAVACLTAMGLRHDAASVHLATGGTAMALALFGSFRVEFARNRHRIAERSRRQIESLQMSSGGTITLPPRPGESLPGIR